MLYNAMILDMFNIDLLDGTIKGASHLQSKR